MVKLSRDYSDVVMERLEVVNDNCPPPSFSYVWQGKGLRGALCMCGSKGVAAYFWLHPEIAKR